MGAVGGDAVVCRVALALMGDLELQDAGHPVVPDEVGDLATELAESDTLLVVRIDRQRHADQSERRAFSNPDPSAVATDRVLTLHRIRCEALERRAQQMREHGLPDRFIEAGLAPRRDHAVELLATELVALGHDDLVHAVLGPPRVPRARRSSRRDGSQ